MKKLNIYKMLGMLVTMALLFAAIPVGSAQAATLCVNPGGTDGCYAKIQDAVNAAVAGDTIEVWDGTYDYTSEGEPDDNGLIKVSKPLTIKALEDGNGIRPVINGTGNDGVFKIYTETFSSGTVVIEGFDITGDPTVGIAITAPMYQYPGQENTVIIRDNLIHGMIGGLDFWGTTTFVPGTPDPAYAITSNIQVLNNQFYDLGVAGLYEGFGVMLEDLAGTVKTGGQFAAVIEGNEFGTILDKDASNPGAGIVVYRANPENGEAVNFRAANNVFTGPVSVDIGIISGDGAAYPEIVGNDFSNAGLGIYSIISDVIDAKANWWGVGTETTGPAAGKNLGTVEVNPWCYTADCTELYVAAGGKIQDGIDLAQEGGVVHVGPGTYAEAILLNKPNITVQSTDGAASTIILTPAGTLTTGVLVSANMGVVTFDGFHVQNFSENGIVQGRTSDVGTTFHVKNNIITPANGYLRNGIQVSGDGSSVTGNTVNGAPLTDGWSSAGIMVVNASNVVVSGNTILGGTLGVDIGISLMNYSETQDQTFTVQNNIVHNAGNAIRLSGGSSALVMSDVLITGNDLSNNVGAINVQTIALQNVDITNNQIVNNSSYGIRFSSTSATATGIVITGNSLLNNDPYQVLGHAGAAIDAPSLVASNTFDHAVTTTSWPFVIQGSIQTSIDESIAGDTIKVYPGTYIEQGQIVINKDLTIIGVGQDLVTIKPAQDTGSADDARGWFLVGSQADPDVNFNLSNVTLDGEGFNIHTAIRSWGTGVIENNRIKNIKYSKYVGLGVYLFGQTTVRGNEFSNIERVGMYAHGLLGPTNAVFEGNTYFGKGVGDWLDYGVEVEKGAQVTISGNTISDCLGIASSDGSGSAAILATTYFGPGTSASIIGNILQNNSVGIAVGILTSDTSTVTAHNNRFISNEWGVITTGPFVDATENFWGTACGPVLVYGDVDFTPWYSDYDLTTLVSELPPAGTYQIPAGATTEEANAIIACAAPGSIIDFQSGTYPGGIIVNRDGLTFNLNGLTVGAGSPAFDIYGDDIVINGPGKLDGLGATDPAIYVNTGADNFILDGVEITGWADGVFVDGAVESLKIVNNWMHTNSESALEVDGTPTGVVTIEGNLFKVNDGVDVVYGGTGTLDATYNSWGAVTGPVDTLVANVAFDPWTFSEIYMDMDPIADDQYTRHVTSTEAFDVEIRAEAANLYGLSFIFQYDNTKLALANTVFDAAWDGPSGDGFCEPLDDLAEDEIGYFCTLLSPDAEWDGGAIATFTFNAIDSGDAYFDVYADDTLKTAATGGVKVWVNNAGFNLPSSAERDLADTNDGLIDIDIAQFTGFIDLEGRPDDSGARVTVYDDDLETTALASATSASSGEYLTAYLEGQSMNFGDTQFIKVDRALFLPSYLLAKELDTNPMTFVQLLKLLGGDATDDNVIDISDASCIGNAYGDVPAACGLVGWSDVNGDGLINIYDLTLMGGNFGKSESSW